MVSKIITRLRTSSASSYMCQGCDDSLKEQAADLIEALLSIAETFRDYARDMQSGALRGRDGQSYEAIGAADLARVDAVLAEAA